MVKEPNILEMEIFIKANMSMDSRKAMANTHGATGDITKAILNKD